jgi:hypothetical protein
MTLSLNSILNFLILSMMVFVICFRWDPYLVIWWVVPPEVIIRNLIREAWDLFGWE